MRAKGAITCRLRGYGKNASGTVTSKHGATVELKVAV
jgi:hypothetical protein